MLTSADGVVVLGNNNCYDVTHAVDKLNINCIQSGMGLLGLIINEAKIESCL